MGREQVGVFEQEWDLDRGSVEVVPRVLPVTVIDRDAPDMAAVAWPRFMIFELQAAVAAVYGLVGIKAGIWPIRLLGITQPASGAQHVMFHWGRTDIRTANQTSGIADVKSLARGSSGPTADVISGTTTVAGAGAGQPYYHSSAQDQWVPLSKDFPSVPFIMLPGEYFWLWGQTANVAFGGQFAWEEMHYAIPHGVV